MDNDFGYNLDDFLHTQESRDTAKRKFPNVYFSLFSSLVSDEFMSTNEAANAAKKTLQNFGIFTITLAFFALTFAAIDIALLAPIKAKNSMQEALATLLPFVAAVFGIASFVIGYFGIGIGKRKTDWLQLRMQTELIRQWRARYYLNRRSSILKATQSEEAAQEYNSEMRREFTAFSEYIKANSNQIFDDIVTGTNFDVPERLNIYLSRVNPPESHDALDSETLEEYYQAYGEMRVGGQTRYSEYIARSDGPLRTHPRAQKETLHKIGILSIFGIVALHLSVTLGVFTGVKALKSIYVHLATVILALTALAIRAIEDGLKPGEHLTRYAGYFTSVSSIAERFESASPGTAQENLAWDLERAAFAEMVDFLRGSHKARFVM